MRSNIIVIPLEILKTDPHYADYQRLDPLSKLEHLAKRLRTHCKQLEVAEPNAMWIFVLREYAITNVDGENNRPVSSDFKKNKFKEKLKDITADYPNATIVAGTIATHKTQPVSKAETIKQYYDALSWIKTVEEADGEDHFQTHLDEANKLILSSNDNIEVIRNTCYVANAGEIVYRHDKIAPFFECQSPTLTNTLFQPGKGKNLNPICSITHPVTGERIILKIKICREHSLEKHDPHLANHPNLEKPHLYIVVSDSIAKLTHFHGNTIHVDSYMPSRLIVTETDDQTNAPVSLIKNNLLDNAELSDRLRKFTLDDYKLVTPLDLLIAIMTVLPFKHPTHSRLIAIRKNCESPLLKTTEALRIYLKTQLIHEEFEGCTFTDSSYQKMFDAAKTTLRNVLKRPKRASPVENAVAPTPMP